MVSYDHIEYSVTDGRAELVLDRPDVLNAFNREMVEEILLALFDAHDRDDAYVIVVTGAGRGFCSGADVSDMSGAEQGGRVDYATHLRNVQSVVRGLYYGYKPTIAAVNGPALGAGCDFALACDLRVMGEDAYLREQFVNIGLIPGDGGGWLLPRLVGEARAKEYVLTGRDIGPEEALEVGLVTDVVDTDAVREEARALANEIRDKPAPAVRRAKDLVGFGRSFEDYCQDAIEAQWAVRSDPEHDEAVSALREGRDPDFDRPY